MVVGYHHFRKPPYVNVIYAQFKVLFFWNRWFPAHLKPDFHRSSAPVHGFSSPKKNPEYSRSRQASCLFCLYIYISFCYPSNCLWAYVFLSVEMFPCQQVMAIIFSANCRRVSVVVALGKDPHQAETLVLGRKVKPRRDYHNIYHYIMYAEDYL